MKKIIAAILAAMTILTLSACGAKDEFNRGREDAKNGNGYNPKATATQTVNVKKLDKIVKDSLGDSVLTTEYKDGTYYVAVVFEGINNASVLYKHDIDESINQSTQIMHNNYGVDSIFFIMDYATKSELLYASKNGADITALMK